jgi:predicted enzyme related to lactoylglutathione lyase
VRPSRVEEARQRRLETEPIDGNISTRPWCSLVRNWLWPRPRDRRTLPVNKEVTMAGEVSFIELGGDDVERGRLFYSNLFGWQWNEAPSGGTSANVGGLQVGIHGDDAKASPYVFFRVDDIGEAADRVRELGGEVDPMDLDGTEESVALFGRFVLCRDDQGCTFGLHQPPAGA